MMVVIMVSRRGGQVTLAVSERTSCRNLNGLNAIVGYPRPSRNVIKSKESEQPSCAQPSVFRDESHMARMFGGIQSRAGYPKNGPTAGGGYVLLIRPKVKVADCRGAQPSGAARRRSRQW